MITVNGFKIKADIFPDKTSQLWHLPKEIILAKTLLVTWYFEEERELFDLIALRQICDKADLILHIPYMPGGRQDKVISNDTTFMKSIYCELLHTLRCKIITTYDIHSIIINDRCYNIHIVTNLEVSDFHKWVTDQFQPNYLVYPDAGAKARYPYLDGVPCITFEFVKGRNQATGQIFSHQLTKEVFMPQGKYLMVDDICDGGATFLSIAEQIKQKVPDAEIGLAVTHGLFSKGKQILTDAGIQLFYTNTLLRNHGAPSTECFNY